MARKQAAGLPQARQEEAHPLDRRGEQRRIKLRVKGTPSQVALVNSNEKFPAFIGGYGSGKTHALIWRALRLLIRDRCDLAYYMPTYALIREIGLRRMMEMLNAAGITAHANIPTFSITAPGYGRILFRSLEDPAKIIGYESGHSLVDELDTMPTHVAEMCWIRILGRNRQFIQGVQNTIAVGTTPEGFRFVYEKWGKDPVKAEKDGYVLYRASTYDNARNLPPDYIKNLEDSYPAALLRAYLNGEFVNLETGIFNVSWFRYGSPPPSLPVVMGVDLAISEKEGADYSAAVIMGRTEDGFIHVIDAVKIRASFHQVIEWIKATAAKYDPYTIAIETIQYQAAVIQELMRTTSLPVVSVKPDKDKATRLLPLAQRYEQGLVFHPKVGLKDLEMELAGFPNAAHDDLCFVAGTLITTEEGLTPIEMVSVGQRVLTRDGYREVVGAGLTGVSPTCKIYLEGGATLEGTENHPVWDGHGWKRLAEISEGDTLSVCCGIYTGDTPCAEKLQSSTGLSSTATLTQKQEATVPISLPVLRTGQKGWTPYTVRFGNLFTDLYRKITSYITWTETLLTTQSTTLSAYPMPSIIGSMVQMNGANNPEGSWIRSETKRRLGTGRKKEGNGTGSTGSELCGNAKGFRLLAQSAIKLLKRFIGKALSIAPQRAIRSQGEQEGYTGQQTRFAPSAGKNTKEQLSKPIVQSRAVRRVKTGNPKPVYNLTVEGTHEYFANGVLVHNCDAAAYAFRALDKRIAPPIGLTIQGF